MSYDKNDSDHYISLDPPFDDVKIKTLKSGRATWRIDFEWTPRYCWYLIPTIEINTSVREIAINILCLGIYIPFRRRRITVANLKP